MRGIVFLVLVLILAGAAVICLAAVSRPAVAEKNAVVIVNPGDTLWSLAVRCRPEEDPRQTVQLIVALNDLEELTIRPGQRLFLPAAGY